jgi:putative oxidoreductase
LLPRIVVAPTSGQRDGKREEGKLTMDAVAISPSRTLPIVLWILRVLAAALFLSAGFMKLIGQPVMVQEFDVIGLGQWFRFLTGILELVGGVAILVPSISVFGAILLLLVDAGAFLAQVTILHMGWVHTIVVAAILGAVIYLQRDRLGF